MPQAHQSFDSSRIIQDLLRRVDELERKLNGNFGRPAGELWEVSGYDEFSARPTLRPKNAVATDFTFSVQAPYWAEMYGGDDTTGVRAEGSVLLLIASGTIQMNAGGPSQLVQVTGAVHPSLGVILTDRTTSADWRLFVDSGVLDIEPA